MSSYINKLDKQKIFLQKGFFSIEERKRLLVNLKNEIISKEVEILDALKKDFNKTDYESYLLDFLPVISEVNYFIKNIKKLSKNKRLWSGFKDFFHSKAYIKFQCYGSILLIVSGDLPFNLSLISIIGAIASGNTIFLKLPSISKNTNTLIKDILGKIFDDHHIFFLEDSLTDVDYKELYQLNFDMVFFFGKSKIGKNIVKNFSSKFIDIVYEVSSKCPVIVDETANIENATKKIVWAKTLNSGQLAFSPDYVLVHEAVYNEFILSFRNSYMSQFPNKKFDQDFAKIYRNENFNRLVNQIEKNKNRVVFGGNYNIENQSVELTLINIDDLKSDLMTTEIFGPILPIIKYNNISDIYGVINHNPSPLATYLFSKNKNLSYEIQQNIESKIIVFNDVVSQIFYKRPLGAIRTSGNRVYGKQFSWDLFTYRRVIIKSKNNSWKNRYSPHPINILDVKNKVSKIK